MAVRLCQPMMLMLLLVGVGLGGCGEKGPDREPVAAPIPPQLLAERDPAATAALIAQGRAAYRVHRCTDCHSVDGSASVGPPLDGIAGRYVQLVDGQVVERDQAYLYQALASPRLQTVAGYPPQLMPDYSHLETETLIALVTYLESLPPAG